MTILIYDYHELEERASQHLRVWKVWHIILYVLAIIFGILNYTFLFKTEQSVTETNTYKCILYPRELDFHWVKLPNVNETTETTILNYTEAPTTKEIDVNITTTSVENEEAKETTAMTPLPNTTEGKRDKRQALKEYTTTEENVTIEESNQLLITENTTHRYVLDPNRSLFSDSAFEEYMPLMSAVVAVVWTTLFLMCPNGGRSRTGLQEPWQIVTPAFVCAFVMVILTGVSFTNTNGGLESFCSAFHNYTNTTACSAVDRFIVPGNSSWGVGRGIAATRAAAAGVWASWACACALLLARCLAAADFVVRRTAVHLVRDPQQKVTPYLQKQKSPRRSQRSTQSSPDKRDTASVKSDPTLVTELVTATVEHEGRQNSEPTSLAVTPLRESRGGEELEMTYTPGERGY